MNKIKGFHLNTNPMGFGNIILWSVELWISDLIGSIDIEVY